MDSQGELTPLGRHLAILPVDLRFYFFNKLNLNEPINEFWKFIGWVS